MSGHEIYEGISIYVVATPEMADLISDCLKYEISIIISGVIHYGQALKIDKKNNTIVIFEYNNAFIAQADAYISALNNEAVPFIAVCNSVKTGFGLLNKGAAEIMSIQSLPDSEAAIKSLAHSLIIKIRTVLKNKSIPKRVLKHTIDKPVNKIIAIGSSTGGTEAVFNIIKALPAASPPILVVQHMPPVFTKLYAERLHRTCAVSVWEARDGDKLTNGLAFIAPGDKHMTLVKKGNDYYVNCFSSEKVNGHCPSVDVLFNSIAKIAARNTIGVILTGMGADGAKGLAEMHKNGSFTIGQDEKSCIVYGMPKAAYELGGVDVQEDLNNIANVIVNHT